MTDDSAVPGGGTGDRDDRIDDGSGDPIDDRIDGHTMDELADYLDRGRTPYDASIENSASCRLALAGMARIQELAWTGIKREAADDPGRDGVWIAGLLDRIRTEVRSGRDIPVEHPDAALRLSLTEAAVRGVVRRAGDTLGGVLMGRCTLHGDVTTLGVPIRVEVTASLEYGLSVDVTAERLRQRIVGALAAHTDLVIERVDIEIDEVYVDQRAPE